LFDGEGWGANWLHVTDVLVHGLGGTMVESALCEDGKHDFALESVFSSGREKKQDIA